MPSWFSTETMGPLSDSTRAVCARKGREMAYTLGDPSLLTDSDVDAAGVAIPELGLR